MRLYSVAPIHFDSFLWKLNRHFENGSNDFPRKLGSLYISLGKEPQLIGLAVKSLISPLLFSCINI